MRPTLCGGREFCDDINTTTNCVMSLNVGMSLLAQKTPV